MSPSSTQSLRPTTQAASSEATTEAATEATTQEALIKMLDVKGTTLEKAQKNLQEAGFTNVKVNAICVDTPERLGVIRDIGEVLQKQNLNITSIYGAGTHNGRARFIIVVNNITQALSALESSGLF